MTRNREIEYIFVRLYDEVTEEKIKVIELEIPQIEFDNFVIRRQGLFYHSLLTAEISAYKRENNPLIKYILEDKNISNSRNNKFSETDILLPSSFSNGYDSKGTIKLTPCADSKEEIYDRYIRDFIKPYIVESKENGTLLLTHHSFKPRRIYSFKIDGPLYNTFLLVSNRFEELGERASLKEIETYLNLGRHIPYTLYKGTNTYNMFLPEANKFQPKTIKLMQKVHEVLKDN